MQIGKLSIIETIIGLELPLTVMIAVFIGGKEIATSTLFFILIICMGVMLTSVKELGSLKLHKHMAERGILLAMAAAVLSSFANFFYGHASQTISPLVTVFVIHLIVAVLCFFVLVVNRQVKETYKNIFKYPKLIFLQTFYDNAAWIGYAYLTVLMPISLAITFSESYIVLAAFFGYYFNKEKLNTHQKIGAVIALTAVLVLAFTIKI